LMGREKTSGERINTETYRMDRLSVGILLTQFPENTLCMRCDQKQMRWVK
jgi:hypothetical protein